MAETDPHSFWNRPASELAEQIGSTFAATGEERSRLHAMLFDGVDHGPYPDDALYLLNKSFADLVGITRHTPTSLAGRREEFAALLYDSPFGRADGLRAWLRDVVGCERVALFIERSDYLRLVLIAALAKAGVPPLVERRSA